MELAIGLPPDGLVGAGREHFDEQQEIEWERQELCVRGGFDYHPTRSACNAANANGDGLFDSFPLSKEWSG